MLLASLSVSPHYYYTAIYDTHSLVYYRRVHCRIDCRCDHAHALRFHRNNIARHCRVHYWGIDRASVLPAARGIQISSSWIHHVNRRRDRRRLPGTTPLVVLSQVTIWPESSPEEGYVIIVRSLGRGVAREETAFMVSTACRHFATPSR